MGNGLGRRTLKDIPYYPTPQEIHDAIITSLGWPYKHGTPRLVARDRALVALLYLGGLRISEAVRIAKEQFIIKDTHILIRSVKLSKSKSRGKPRRIQFREVRLPLVGERTKLTQLVMDYANILAGDELLFPFGGGRGWQIVTSILPEHTCHWLRAYGENYLYGKWENDLLAVADYVKVDPRTLGQYIRRRDEKYPPV